MAGYCVCIVYCCLFLLRNSNLCYLHCTRVQIVWQSYSQFIFHIIFNTWHLQMYIAYNTAFSAVLFCEFQSWQLIKISRLGKLTVTLLCNVACKESKEQANILVEETENCLFFLSHNWTQNRLRAYHDLNFSGSNLIARISILLLIWSG